MIMKNTGKLALFLKIKLFYFLANTTIIKILLNNIHANTDPYVEISYLIIPLFAKISSMLHTCSSSHL